MLRMNRFDGKALQYRTRHLPGIGGVFKDQPEDFRVEEVPLYHPSGQGTHTYFTFEKSCIATRDAIQRIARHLGIDPRDIGVAGLKDAQAITQQTASAEHLTPAQERKLADYRDGQIRVLAVNRHSNKLKIGHLTGNRFRIRIRRIHRDAHNRAVAILEVLSSGGVPNYFGVQRFGRRGDNALLGSALLKHEAKRFADLFLGGAEEDDPARIRRARTLYDKGDLQEALRTWPRTSQVERRALQRIVKAKGDAKAVFRGMDQFLRNFLLSALQSHLFNRVVNERIDELDAVRLGDIAQKTDSGGTFFVEDEAAELERAKRFQISATGPLFGYRVSLARGWPGDLEMRILEEEGFSQEDWRRQGAHKIKGLRRPLRFPLRQCALQKGEDSAGRFLELGFFLPAGCYATAVLREVMKNGQPDKFHGLG